MDYFQNPSSLIKISKTQSRKSLFEFYSTALCNYFKSSDKKERIEKVGEFWIDSFTNIWSQMSDDSLLHKTKLQGEKWKF